MLSYRHGFHAGNHADVLKHFVQVQLHKYMNQKDTAYTYIDTHSGAGVYALDSDYAAKNAEYATGIAPLWNCQDLPAALAEYVDLVHAMNPSGKLRYYPGSPYVAEQMAREHDRLRLFELHPADCKNLAENFRRLEAHQAEQGVRARGKRVIIERGDGFLSLKSLLPPPSRRALVLIDPPYEVKDDYRRVKEALDDALGRFPSGTFAVWYPVLQRMESRQFPDKLKRVAAKEWLNVTLTISTPTPDGVGLHTSGMFLLNPPYTLEPILRQVMPYLVRVLGTDAGASFTIEKGTQVTGAAVGRAGAGNGPRQPVGNARRASPLSGGGSLRLPGQKMEEGRPAPGARADGQARPGAQREARAPGAASRDGQARPAGQRDARPSAAGQRDARPATAGQRDARPPAASQREGAPMRNASRGPSAGAANGDRPSRPRPAGQRETAPQQQPSGRSPRNRRG
jgi:23S rRNA (adenine2030-N6)-methyltransferase